MPLSTVHGDPDPGRARQAVAARAARAAQPLRAQAAGRAAAHRRQEARPHRPRRRPPHHRQATGHRGPRASAASGWEFVHVCVDDATRLAYVEVLRGREGHHRVGFLRRAVAFYRAHGIQVERVMTDNGSGYRRAVHASPAGRCESSICAPGPTGPAPTARPSASSAHCSAAGPTAPSTRNSAQRDAALSGWLDFYNRRRPHGSLDGTNRHDSGWRRSDGTTCLGLTASTRRTGDIPAAGTLRRWRTPRHPLRSSLIRTNADRDAILNRLSRIRGSGSWHRANGGGRPLLHRHPYPGQRRDDGTRGGCAAASRWTCEPLRRWSVCVG